VQIDPNPFFRKIISPWYDSDPVCVCVMILLALTFLFSLAGIAVAKTVPEFNAHLWVPVLLAVLSAWVLLSIARRLIRRYVHRAGR
jgi:hypothetical protein